jgi:hypothetical protein
MSQEETRSKEPTLSSTLATIRILIHLYDG